MSPEELEQFLARLMDRSATKLVLRAEETQLIIDGFFLANPSLPDEVLLSLIQSGGSSTVGFAVSGFARKIASLISEVVDFSFANGMVTYSIKDVGGDGRALMTWETRPGLSKSGKSCPDCVARNGETKTLEEWELEGLPGAGTTLCGDHCNCTIEPKR
jgi:hypothetical protein